MSFVECGGIPTFYPDDEDYYNESDSDYLVKQSKPDLLCFLFKVNSLELVGYFSFSPMMGNYTTDDF